MMRCTYITSTQLFVRKKIFFSSKKSILKIRTPFSNEVYNYLFYYSYVCFFQARRPIPEPVLVPCSMANLKVVSNVFHYYLLMSTRKIHFMKYDGENENVIL